MDNPVTLATELLLCRWFVARFGRRPKSATECYFAACYHLDSELWK